MRISLVLLAGVLATNACVSKRKYTATEAALTQAKTDLAAAASAREALQGELDTANSDRSRMTQELTAKQQGLTDLQRKLAEVESQLNSERSEKAELLKTRAQLKNSISEMTAALDELAKRKVEADKRVAAFQDLVDRFKDLINAGKLQVKIIDGRMVVQLATDVLFGSGSASLSTDGRQAIREVADVLKSIPDRRFQVEGHTDNVPISTERYPSNWELASARAVTVVKEMLDVGMPPGRISASSYSEHDPVAPNRTTEGKAMNRRIQIVIIPDLSGLPGYEELQDLSGK
ncbi:MAG: OmpA family protein [Myxococcota bacterium]